MAFNRAPSGPTLFDQLGLIPAPLPMGHDVNRQIYVEFCDTYELRATDSALVLSKQVASNSL